ASPQSRGTGGTGDAHSSGKSELGLTGASRAPSRTWGTKSRAAPSRLSSSGTAWNPRAGAQPQDNLEGVSEATLGSDRGCRFLLDRSLDATRPTAVRHPVFHGTVDTQGGDRWHRVESQRVVDESGRPQPHGCSGRLAERQALPHTRSRSIVHRRVPAPAGRSGRCLGEASTSQSQSERARGTVCTNDQGILPGADDLVRRGGGAESDC